MPPPVSSFSDPTVPNLLHLLSLSKTAKKADLDEICPLLLSHFASLRPEIVAAPGLLQVDAVVDEATLSTHILKSPFANYYIKIYEGPMPMLKTLYNLVCPPLHPNLYKTASPSSLPFHALSLLLPLPPSPSPPAAELASLLDKIIRTLTANGKPKLLPAWVSLKLHADVYLSIVSSSSSSSSPISSLFEAADPADLPFLTYAAASPLSSPPPSPPSSSLSSSPPSSLAELRLHHLFAAASVLDPSASSPPIPSSSPYALLQPSVEAEKSLHSSLTSSLLPSSLPSTSSSSSPGPFSLHVASLASSLTSLLSPSSSPLPPSPPSPPSPSLAHPHASTIADIYGYLNGAAKDYPDLSDFKDGAHVSAIVDRAGEFAVFFSFSLIGCLIA